MNVIINVFFCCCFIFIQSHQLFLFAFYFIMNGHRHARPTLLWPTTANTVQSILCPGLPSFILYNHYDHELANSLWHCVYTYLVHSVWSWSYYSVELNTQRLLHISVMNYCTGNLLSSVNCHWSKTTFRGRKLQLLADLIYILCTASHLFITIATLSNYILPNWHHSTSALNNYYYWSSPSEAEL